MIDSSDFRVMPLYHGTGQTSRWRSRVAKDGQSLFLPTQAASPAELLLVSGFCGVGKSSVVDELHKVLVPPRGLFAAGKFDQYQRDVVPYATLARAFRDAGAPDPGQERGRRRVLASRLAGGLGAEWPTDGRPDTRSLVRHRQTTARGRTATARSAGPASRWCSGLSSARSPARSILSVVPRRSAVAGFGNSGTVGSPDY